jgi:hypothetical protein
MIETASQIDDVFNKVDEEIKRVADEKAEKGMGQVLQFKKAK